MTPSELYQQHYGRLPERIERIGAGAGSMRTYSRLYGTPTVIGTEGVSEQENMAYLSFSRLFESEGLNVPKVLAVSPDNMTYLQEDLGDVALFSFVGKSEWYDTAEKVLQMLPAFQIGPNGEFAEPEAQKKRLADVSYYPSESMDYRSVMWDLNYFKYCMLKPYGIEFDEALLEQDFERFAKEIVNTGPKGLILRDLQSRNVMLRDGKPYIIDFQGARIGPILYDAVSFLWQAKARVEPSMREYMLYNYVSALPENVRKQVADRSMMIIPLFRTLQVLGAYGFRGLVQGKAHFVESIPYALWNLSDVMYEVREDFGYTGELMRCLEKLANGYDYYPREEQRLQVEVNSFGFRKGGIPRDFTGNGGGFVFDCRALPNPGRYPAFKFSTGKDAKVKEFLEAYSKELQPFLDAAAAMIEAAVANYRERRFRHLKVSFGCTGGQHRSVYCAEWLSQRLRERFKDIDVTTIHREEKNWPKQQQ
ncbi:MAG: phosphotransferase [Muribaculaceae bacterium]|nr:phosphotransferase [Muribaculaceae bacterium]